MERELNSMPSRNSAKESSSSFRASDGKQLKGVRCDVLCPQTAFPCSSSCSFLSSSSSSTRTFSPRMLFSSAGDFCSHLSVSRSSSMVDICQQPRNCRSLLLFPSSSIILRPVLNWKVSDALLLQAAKKQQSSRNVRRPRDRTARAANSLPHSSSSSSSGPAAVQVTCSVSCCLPPPSPRPLPLAGSRIFVSKNLCPGSPRFASSSSLPRLLPRCSLALPSSSLSRSLPFSPSAPK
mmetsp:Transcript_18598/g.42464  ORF Transcript_18598/g.42464 Transcript_18598/m.42464 type:complete len:236 (-) Transcript_18598:140-847(-)